MDPLGLILKVQTPRNKNPCYYSSFVSLHSFLCSSQLLAVHQISCNSLLSHQLLCTIWSLILEIHTQLMNSYMFFKPIHWPSSPELPWLALPFQVTSLPLFSNSWQPWAGMDTPSSLFTCPPPPGPHRMTVSLKGGPWFICLWTPSPWHGIWPVYCWTDMCSENSHLHEPLRQGSYSRVMCMSSWPQQGESPTPLIQSTLPLPVLNAGTLRQDRKSLPWF